jgi:hypothetical protein
MIMKKNSLMQLKRNISQESKAIKEIDSLFDNMIRAEDSGERNMIKDQINTLSKVLKKANADVETSIKKVFVPKKLEVAKAPMAKAVKPAIAPAVTPPKTPVLKPAVLFPKKTEIAPVKSKPVVMKMNELEKETLKRLRKKEKKEVKKKEKKASGYIRLSNKFFSGMSKSLIGKGYFKNLKRDLVKANMQYLTQSYVSMIFFNTLVSFLVSFFIVGFLLFFNIGVQFPFITPVRGSLVTRFLSLFWLLFAIPIGTYLFTLFYPVLEKKSIEAKINQELPFATIHMASISESMVEPSNIFKIIISTGEYPTLEKEFTKLLNEINVFGHDLVTSLRNVAFNSPSRRLSELLDGLATTITSGGDLSDFFDKRAQSLLFEYRLEREKQTKSAETFMDIYISVVIAAPMILMLLLIMMRISGLGIALSTSMIALVMVLGVSIINIVFLAFLQLKQRNQ